MSLITNKKSAHDVIEDEVFIRSANENLLKAKDRIRDAYNVLFAVKSLNAVRSILAGVEQTIENARKKLWDK